MPAAIYTRQSLDRTGQEAGVSRQLSESQALADRLNLDVAYELSDNDISATSGKLRPAFQQLMKLVEKGKVDTVVVWHPDRLYRVLRDLVPLMDLASSRGLSIVSVTAGEMDLNTPHGRMLAGILGSVSANEGEHKAERQKLAYKTRASQGHWGFARRPYGYQRAADGSVVQVPSEAAIVREMYVRHFEQGESRYAVLKWLQDQDLTTPVGKPWDVDAVRNVLRNPGYGGWIVYRGEVVGRGQHEPVIDPDTWNTYISGATKTANNFKRQATSMVSGLATCAVCGEKIYRKRRGNNDKYEYRCHANLCVSIDASMTDAYVRSEVISALLLGPTSIIPDDRAGASLTALQAQLEDVQTRRSDLLSLVSEGLAKLTDIRSQLEDLKKQESELQQRRDALTHSNVAAQVLVGLKAELFEGHKADLTKGAEIRAELGQRFDALPLGRQRDLIALLLDIQVGRGKGTKRLYVTHRVVESLNTDD